MTSVTEARPEPKRNLIGYDEAAAFLSLLTDEPAHAARVIFQTFTDGKKPKRDPLARVLPGTLRERWPELQRLNAAGAGVFVTVNEMRGQKRGTADFKAARAIFQEDDDGAPALPLAPHIVVESSPGKFHRYLLTATDDRDAWEAVQQTMVDLFGSDPRAKDCARVLRLPGFLHKKNPAAPFRVRLCEWSIQPRYAWDEIVAAIPPASVKEKKVSEAAGKPHALMEADAREMTPHLHGNDDREKWLETLWEFRRSWRKSTVFTDEATWLDILVEWSSSAWRADKSAYASCRAEVEAKWVEADDRDGPGIGALWNRATAGGWAPDADQQRRLHCEPPGADDFKAIESPQAMSPSPLHGYYAYLPQHTYIDRVTRQHLPVASINGNLRDKKIGELLPAAWLDLHRAVNQMTWDPGRGEVIENEIVAESGWLRAKGKRVYNLYRAAPRLAGGDATKAGPWLDHVKRVYPDDAEHLVKWFAQRVQSPGNKINHALVLGGPQGIGKDTLLEPVKIAVGHWNFNEISPPQMLGRFNAWIKSVILRVSEARDLGAVDRFSFYDHSKSYIAAPPDVLSVDEKHIREYSVVNVLGVIITTNHKLDGIYLPADDRRHFVAWSDADKADFNDEYWNGLWGWYRGEGGLEHVATYLHEFDLSGFDPKAPPPKTDTFWQIVGAGIAPEDSELVGLLDALGNPDAVTVEQLRTANAMTEDDTISALLSAKAQRALPHQFDRAGYVSVRNPNEKRGKWKVQGKNTVVYVRADLTIGERLGAAAELCRVKA
ncbi:MAG: DNA-primase RepB domain-containing protein [Woeseia sp.]